MAPRKNTQSTAAEISLVHLKNCLVNLPSSLVNLLLNINTPAQNVIVELSYRASESASQQKSVYLGWTGLPSKRRMVPIVSREGGIHGSRGLGGTGGGIGLRDQEVALVEMDPTLATTLGLHDGQKVLASVHLDPPLARTVNIEPLTAEDWEMIELHATFLELNMLSQIRALPNPAYVSPSSGAVGSPSHFHPLTLHLSPTSSANVRVVSLDPPPPGDAPFAKISPDAEVVVAPKSRANKASRGGKGGARSVDSASRKSSSSTVRRRGGRADERGPALFLRALDRRYCDDWFDDDAAEAEGLSVWIERDLLFAKGFRGVNHVTVSLMRPASLQDVQQRPLDSGGGVGSSGGIAARLRAWDDPPSGSSAALSTPLCASLCCQGIVGGVVKIEPAPQPFALYSKTSTRVTDDGGAAAAEADPPNTIRRIKVFPFLQRGNAPSSSALRFGSESKAEREEAAKRLRQVYDLTDGKGLLQGPLTDGQVLGVYEGIEKLSGWEGGMIKFDPPRKAGQGIRETASWIMGSQWQIPFDFQPPIPAPPIANADLEKQEEAPDSDGVLLGIDSLLTGLKSHLEHMSSVLLTGSMGSGKTSVARNLASTLKRESFFHTTYFPCRSLVNDETRISTIRETLNRVFLAASWGARLGGRSIVILDDVDRLCPVETELQVGNDNGRSRQVSEALCAIVRQYCTRDGGVVLLATAHGKEAVNNAVIGGHVVREIVELKAPDKEARRRVMEAIAGHGALTVQELERPASMGADHSRPTTASGSVAADDGAWMDAGGPSHPSRRTAPPRLDGFVLQPDLDFLEVAGKTDGYMPGDLVLLVTRARNAALSRALNESPDDDTDNIGVPLAMEDFEESLKGFTPAALHNVSLQGSTTTFDSIGGLRETRRVLLETLQYPTKYAPIFAQCPLRLRSGLLLYGFPGCGKTLLASAVAGECGLNFISVKGPEILNKYIGASEKSVRDLFERASAAKPCVLFFDEFDSIAPKRGHDSTGVTDRVVNQLLTQMDGAEGLAGVYVLAATSRPDLIDPALLRPGRLDKSLLCDFPNLEDRLDIIRALAKKVNMDGEVMSSDEDLVELGRRTEGFTGADLQALMSNAQLQAIHDVLDDREGVSANSAGASSSGRRTYNEKKSPSKAPESSSGRRPFVQFRYGQPQQTAQEGTEETATSRSSELAEQAAIAAKLEGIKLARKRARAMKAGRGGVDGTSGKPGGGKGQGGGGGGGSEVVIGWKHIIKALDETRASISSEERARLERIYREFVVGRSGEMRDGQGSMEIGGRSSLM